MFYLIVAAFMGYLTGGIAKKHGSSFGMWFVIGFIFPLFGLLGAFVLFEVLNPNQQ